MINREDIYWIFYCISEQLRENKIHLDINIQALVDRMPYGIIRQAATLKNMTPIFDWIMEHLGYEENLDGWIKK